MPLTTRLEIDDQTNGSNNNTWGDVTDSNLQILEQAIAGVTSITTTGGTTTLTSSQNRFPILVITGALVSNATVTVRAAEKNWTILNQTTGAFTVTVKTAAGTGVLAPRGQAVKLYCDGTNVLNVPLVVDCMASSVGGTANAVTLACVPPLTAFVDGMEVGFRATAANTGAMTIQVDGLAAKNFQADVSGVLTALSSGSVANGAFITARYNLAADVFVWVNRGQIDAGLALKANLASSNTFLDRQTIIAGYAAWQLFPTTGTANQRAFRLQADTGNFTIIGVDDSDNLQNFPLQIQWGGNIKLSTNTLIVSNTSGIGYGTGSGGSVTQITNKSTAVTLNRPSGVIVMHNASLGAGASVQFTFNNSVILSTDVLILTVTGSTFTGYRVEPVNVVTGQVGIRVTNVTGAALTDALSINFAILRGATS